jgi:hypothetical protein
MIVSRVSGDILVFVRYIEVHIEKVIDYIGHKKENNILNKIKVNNVTEFLKNFLLKNKYPIGITVFILLVLYFIYLILLTFI